MCRIPSALVPGKHRVAITTYLSALNNAAEARHPGIERPEAETERDDGDSEKRWIR